MGKECPHLTFVESGYLLLPLMHHKLHRSLNFGPKSDFMCNLAFDFIV